MPHPLNAVAIAAFVANLVGTLLALAEVDRDKGRLEQVFQNLLANAVQLSPRGSTVGVRARDARRGVACVSSPGGAVFTVWLPAVARGEAR